MAFVDKVTKMRRCAIIETHQGNIEYEGVEIEGIYVLKKVGQFKNVSVFEEYSEPCFDEPNYETAVNDFINENLADYHIIGMKNPDFELVYEDKQQEDFWVPREDSGLYKENQGRDSAVLKRSLDNLHRGHQQKRRRRNDRVQYRWD
jgi:hypothetical protein